MKSLPEVATRLTGIGSGGFRSLTRRLAAASSPSEHQAIISAELERLRPIWRENGRLHGGVTKSRISCPDCPDSRGYIVVGGKEEWCSTCNGYTTIEASRACPECRGARHVQGFDGIEPCPQCGTKRSPAILLARAKVPPGYQGFSLDSYISAGGRDESTAVELVRMLDDGVRAFSETVGRRGIFFYGGTGRGKTGLAVCALRSIVESNASKMAFATWEYYLESKRPDNSDDRGRRLPRTEAVMAQPTESDLAEAYAIVLDDVGQVGDAFNSWRAEQLYRILDARSAWSGGFTIITSNLSPSEFESAFGARAWSRVKGLCHQVFVDGDDLRELD